MMHEETLRMSKRGEWKLKKRSVAILTNRLYGGGAERMISYISEPLSEKYELYILTLQRTDRDYVCGGTVINIGGKKNYWKSVFYAASQINKLLKRLEIECMISFLTVPDLLNIVCNRRCVRVINLRNYYTWKNEKTISEKIRFCLCRMLYCKADYTIAVSKELLEDSIKCYRIVPDRISVIENFTETEEVQEEAEQDVLTFIESHITAIAIGRLDRQKNYMEMLRCFSNVREKEPRAGLLILGEGAERGKIEAEIRNRGLEKDVLLAGNKRNPFFYMKKCRIYVSFSLYEGFPNALLEAMSCGLPVIHTACKTGPKEILLGENASYGDIRETVYASYGILIPDYLSINKTGIKRFEIGEMAADCWVKLLTDDSLYRKYGERVKKRAGDYTKENCISKYMSVIEQVCGNRS